jgi:plastocyanin
MLLNQRSDDMAEKNVKAKDNTFDPTRVSVNVGDTVIWTNEGGNTHTVTAEKGEFDSGDLPPGETFKFKFEQAGTVAYKCEKHNGMNGTVVVT